MRCAIKLYRYLRDECGLTLEETDFTLSWHHHQRDIGVSALSDESASHSHTTTKTSGTRPVGRIPVCFFSDTDATRAPRFNYHCPNMGMFAHPTVLVGGSAWGHDSEEVNSRETRGISIFYLMQETC